MSKLQKKLFHNKIAFVGILVNFLYGKVSTLIPIISAADLLYFQGVEHKVNEYSGYFRRTVEDINNSAFDTYQ